MLRHSKAKTVTHEPNRLVADARHAVNLVGAHAFFAGAHQVGDKQPAMQGNMRILKHRSNRRAELLTASVALPDAFADGPTALKCMTTLRDERMYLNSAATFEA